MQEFYKYDAKSIKDFYNNANVITQYKNINDREYYNYYHNTALLYAVQINIESAIDFVDYIDNNPIKIFYSDAIKFIQKQENKNENQKKIKV